MANIEFHNNEIFHLYNRGIDKRIVFSCRRDFIRFLQGLRYFNSKETTGHLPRALEGRQACRPSRATGEDTKLIEILAYCLLPNHFHLIVKQVSDGGISKFMQKLGAGYTWYFNLKYERSGSLFQGKFKSVHVGSPNHLLWLSAYVNGNAEIHGYKKCDDWPWSSYPDYIGERNGQLCCREELFRWSEFSGDLKEYRELAQSAVAESKHRKESIKKELKQKTLE